MHFTRYVNIYRQPLLLLKLWGGKCMMCRITENVIRIYMRFQERHCGKLVWWQSLKCHLQARLSKGGRSSRKPLTLTLLLTTQLFSEFFYESSLEGSFLVENQTWKILFHYLEGNQDICVLDFCFLTEYYYSMCLVHTSLTISAMRDSEKNFEFINFWQCMTTG
jgi:hypothetical protein